MSCEIVVTCRVSFRVINVSQFSLSLLCSHPVCSGLVRLFGLYRFLGEQSADHSDTGGKPGRIFGAPNGMFGFSWRSRDR
jgi:hypothetical protein